MSSKERWSCFFDRLAARLRWIRVSYQAAILMGSVLLAWTSFEVKMPWVEWGLLDDMMSRVVSYMSRSRGWLSSRCQFPICWRSLKSKVNLLRGLWFLRRCSELLLSRLITAYRVPSRPLLLKPCPLSFILFLLLLSPLLFLFLPFCTFLLQ